MARRHIMITGTGRCGTSFLVELLTYLGLDTGFTVESLERKKSKLARAGLEHDIRKDDAPLIVKNPWFCDHADEVLGRDDIIIEQVLIPMRDLKGAAESRRFVTAETVASMSLFKRLQFRLFPKTVPGGIWHTNVAEEQENVLLAQIYNLILALSKTTIPVVLMQYPRVVQDPLYLYEKLHSVIGEIPYFEFQSAFAKVADEELVHRFSETDLWAA